MGLASNPRGRSSGRRIGFWVGVALLVHAEVIAVVGVALYLYAPRNADLQQAIAARGGEQESIEQDQTHFGGKEDVSRLSFTVGRVFLPDFIDNNAYADEPRSGFLNWSIWAAGAFDFPADQPGYSWGAFAELNQKDWAVRAGSCRRQARRAWPDRR